MYRTWLAAAFAALTTQSLAANLASYCSGSVCYALNIPANTAKTGKGDIYFQLSGPTSYSWIGLGQGGSMTGSNIFIIYADGQGNVTLSPRLGTGDVEPDHDTAAQVTLLAGSGVSGDKMVANVLCSNCDKWSGGSMDFSSTTNPSWIHASKPGAAIDSASVTENLEEHEDHGSFTFDFAQAKGGNDVNPFVKQVKSTTKKPTTASAGSASSSAAASSAASGSVVPVSPPAASGSAAAGTEAGEAVNVQLVNTFVTVHGTVAAIAFVAVFPAGAIFIRLPTFGRFIWIHAGIQIFGYVLYAVAAGFGIYVAKVQDQLMDHHPIIGLVILGVFLFQPFLGVIHHLYYKIKQRRTMSSYAHLFIGRAGVLLGMINGGLGLQLASAPMKYKIAYAVVAAVMGAAYLCAMIYGEINRRRSRNKQDAERKQQEWSG